MIWDVPNTRFGNTKEFRKTGLVDNTATAVFTVTTTDESGSLDGGSYVCDVLAIVGHTAVNNNVNAAAVWYRGKFVRLQHGAGTGILTAVEDNATGTVLHNNDVVKDIDTVAMTVTEVSEYQVQVEFTVDVSGSGASTAEITVFVRVLNGGFTTMPVIAAA